MNQAFQATRNHACPPHDSVAITPPPQSTVMGLREQCIAYIQCILLIISPSLAFKACAGLCGGGARCGAERRGSCPRCVQVGGTLLPTAAHPVHAIPCLHRSARHQRESGRAVAGRAGVCMCPPPWSLPSSVGYPRWVQVGGALAANCSPVHAIPCQHQSARHQRERSGSGQRWGLHVPPHRGASPATPGGYK